MNKITLMISIFVVLLSGVFSQTYEFHIEDDLIQHIEVDSVAAFDGFVTNTTQDIIQIAFVRTQNYLPESWSSTMCVGTSCYPSFIDSVAVSFNPGESKDFIVDIIAYSIEGTANVQVAIFDLAFPDDKIITDYQATTDPLDNHYELEISNYELMQCYPNPFNPQTTISYQLPAPSSVFITIYNINGQLVEELVGSSTVQEAGSHFVVWNAGQHPSGIYFAKLQANSFTLTQKLSLLK